MPFDLERSRRAGGHGLEALGPVGPTPGKQTQVEGLRLGAAGAVQRKAGPIQRQEGLPHPPRPRADGPVVYQYGPGTREGRYNDCGPACIWMVLRMLGAQYEAQLDRFIVANRPGTPAYKALYFPDAETPPPAPTPAERLDLARWCTSGHPVSPMPSEEPPRGTISITDVREGIMYMLGLLGVAWTPEQLGARIDEILPLLSDSGAIYDVPSHATYLTDYMKEHATGSNVVVCLGQPQAYDEDGQRYDTAWGWGGDTRWVRGARTASKCDTGHFVIIQVYDPVLDQFTILDPSFSFIRHATAEQLLAYLAAFTSSAVVNLLSVPIAALRERAADAQPDAAGPQQPAQRKATGAGTGAGAPDARDALDAPAGAGAGLPAPTLAKMERAFATSFAGVRVHEDDAAAQVGALAFARGEDLHFAPGQYRPGTATGDALIGHELAHVVQQRQGRVAGDGVVDDHGLEAEADREGDRAAGLADLATDATVAPLEPAAPVLTSTTAGPGPIQRRDDASGGGGGAVRPMVPLPPGPIPPALLEAAFRDPAAAIRVANWVTANLYDREGLRAFWAAPANQATRGAVLGELAVRAAKLELMLGWISVGGLDPATAQGLETSSGDNHSGDDTSSNHGVFPQRYQAQYHHGAGMAGWDWCGMFVGYLYSQVLGLDNPGLGSDGIEGWRGGDTVIIGAPRRIYPQRVLVEDGAMPFGAFTGWSDMPRPGDVAVLSWVPFDRTNAHNNAEDTRRPDHVSLVEEVTDQRIRTVDGNVAVMPLASSLATGELGKLPNAIAGRGYALGSADAADGGAAWIYNQSRIICLVRMTDRASNFAAPTTAVPAADVPTAAQLIAHADAANAQAQALLNAMPATAFPFDATGTVYGWMKGVSEAT